MRIKTIRIRQWRNFENIELQLDDESKLVCVVGANGTGKSHLLELIAACAHRLGLSHGVEISRGNPFNDPHDFSLQLSLSAGLKEHVEEALSAHAAFNEWDRTLTITSKKLPGTTKNEIRAGGVEDEAQVVSFAKHVVGQLNKSAEVNLLSLDADRAYPNKSINWNEIAQAYEIEWESRAYTRGRSFKSTYTLYDEWIKYSLARENQSATQFTQSIRRAREHGVPEPRFEDHFLGYREALKKVLPHLVFTAIDSTRRTLLFIPLESS